MAQLRAKQIKLAAADDLLIGGTGGNGTVLTKGTAGQVLKVLTGGALGYELAKAADTTFDKGTTTLTSTNVESAIRELAGLAGTGVAGVQAELDAVENAVGLNADGTYTVPANMNYVAANTLKGGVAELDAALKAVDTAYKAADTTLTTDLAAEVTRATAAEGVLRTDLASEVTNRTAADTLIRTDFAAADTALDGKITTERDRATAAEGVLTTAVSDEATTRGTNDAAIRAGAGLEASGAYAADATTTYLKTATTLKDADHKLDAAVKKVADDLAALGSGSITGLQSEVDLIETGLGFGTDGAKPDFTSVNYVGATDSVFTAVNKLDAQVKVNTDGVTAVNSRIDALGAAFNYVGVLEGGATAGAALLLDSLPAAGKDAGDYYKVSVGGYFKKGAAAAFYVNVGDGLVFNTTGGVDIIDNTNANVLAGQNIAVTGNADTGFAVALTGVVPIANGGTGKAALESVTAGSNKIVLGAGAANSVVNGFTIDLDTTKIDFKTLTSVNNPGAAQEDKFLKWTSTGLAYVSAGDLGATIREEEDFAPATAANAAVTLAHAPMGKVAVFINGVKLKKAGYAVDGLTVTLVDSANGYGIETGDTLSVSYSYSA